MSKDNNAVLKTGEAADSVAVKAEQGKTLATCPDLSQWNKSEIMKRRIFLTDEGFKYQTKILKAEHELSKAVDELNKVTDSGESELAAKAIFIVAEKKKLLATLKKERQAGTQERLKLEAYDREQENARYESGPQVFLADGRMTRIS